MVNTKIRFSFFVAEDGEAVYIQQKQESGMNVAQIISFSQQNSGLNERKQGKPLGQPGTTQIRLPMNMQWK